MLTLKNSDISEIQRCLLYLKMNQLKRVCDRLDLEAFGKKNELIERIVTFLKTGEKISAPQIPAASKAKRAVQYPLDSQIVMLHGAYTNDLATRNFFKKIIGDHFHFTAYGIDWLNERWMAGNPPTYAEFAEFWEQERLRRKKRKPDPKEEWAYINFLQDYFTKAPHAPKSEAIAAWKVKQYSMVEKVMHMLDIRI